VTRDSATYDRVYERFQLIANSPAFFNAIVTANDLGLFRYLSQHPGAEFDDLRTFTGVNTHKLRILLLGLCTSELVVKEDGRYRNHAVAQQLLAAEGPESWRHILPSWHRLYYPAFHQMTEALRTDSNTGIAAHSGNESTLYQRLAHDPESEHVFHTAMAAFTLQTMDGLLDNLDLGSTRRLLDIGGGNGTTAARVAERNPHVDITLFDLPSVVDLAKSRLPDRFADRIELVAGDMFADDLPVGADAALLSHVLDTVSAERAVMLLSKVFDLLPPGGKIFIYGLAAGDDERGGVLAARLSLYLNVLATGEGMAWPVADCAGWLRQIGCEQVTSVEGLPYEHGLVVGIKDR
jgi:SAM-dependent methyltransferase